MFTVITVYYNNNNNIVKLFIIIVVVGNHVCWLMPQYIWVLWPNMKGSVKKWRNKHGTVYLAVRLVTYMRLHRC